MEHAPHSSASFNWAGVAPGDETYALALDAYNAGHTFPEIVSLLESRRLAPELIPEVTTAVAQDRTYLLFAAGKSRSDVVRTLTERGLSGKEAEQIAGAVERGRDKALASIGMGKWQTRSLIVGGVLFMAGLVMYGMERLGVLVVPGEWIAGLLGAGVLLAGFGGVYIAFRVRPL